MPANDRSDHAGPGETRATASYVETHDWSQSPLGDPAGWPDRLRGAVDAAAASPLPVAVLWGTDATLILNDAFAAAAGTAGREALGRPLTIGGAVLPDLAAAELERARGGERLVLRDRSLVAGSGDGGRPRFDLHLSALPAEGVPGAICVAVAATAPRLAPPPVAAPVQAAGEHQQALILTLMDRFRASESPAAIVADALAILGRELGASRVSYADIDLAHGEAAFSSCWHDEGVTPRTGAVSLDRLGAGQAAAMREGRTVQVEDEQGAALLAPLMRDARIRALILVERRGVGPWLGDDVALVEEVAARVRDATERIEAAVVLRRNQARQGFLLVLGDRLRELDDPDEISETVSESIGRHMRLARVGYGELMGDEIVFGTGWSDGRLPPAVGGFPLASLGEDHVADLSRGLTTIFEAESGSATPLLEGLGTAAGIPLIRDGRLRGVFLLGHRTRHDWSADEIALGGEVAARLWEALERTRAEAALHELNATLETRVIQRTEELTASETRFRTLFENAPAPIFLIDAGPGLEATFDGFNAAAERFFGRSAAEIRGEPVSGTTRDGEAMLDVCLRCAETGQPVSYEITVEDGDGARTAECMLAPLPLADGLTQVLIGIARDITAQRDAEEQLRQAQKMEAIGQLTGGIAHDFNNLLTGIIGSLALMEKRLAQGRTEVVARYAGLAMASASRAAALTHRLLAFSRRQPLEAKSVDVNALVSDMDELLRRTLGESVRLETVVADDVWMTLCDPHQLENALLNLAINGRDAMPNGGQLTIATANSVVDEADASRHAGLDAGEYVTVAVSDTGTGMAPDVIARAFDPFFTTKPIGQGTGLGLSMIYGFAKQSEGHITIDSELGRGTTVRIFLPRVRGRDVRAADQPADTGPRRGAGETVLVVEDDAAVRNLVLEVLSELGYNAVEASDGPSGVQALDSERRIDLLVTDVGLPGLNGRQVAEHGRARRPDLKVLFITGYAENTAFGAGHLEAGMGLLTKPFTVDELANRLRVILEGP